MDLQKIINIFEEHGFNENNCPFFRQEDITDIAKDIEAAINYTHCCKSDSEQLPTGYTKCNCSNAKDRLDCGFECYNK